MEYLGDLKKPMAPPKIGLLASDEQISEIEDEIRRERYRRMIQLFDAHAIRRGDWEALCFSLADSYVPGFKLAKGRAGAPRKWGEYERAMLVLAVEKTGLDITEATKRLCKQEPWKGMVSHGRGSENLRDEYYRADARMVAIAKSAQAFDTPPDDEKESARNPSGEY